MTGLVAVALAMIALACGPAPSRPAEGSPHLQLLAPEDDPSRAFVEVNGLSAPLVEALRAASFSDEEWSRVLWISVYEEETPGENTPAVLGRYEVVGESLRFAPLFGLDAGRRYRVRFDPNALTEHSEGTAEPVESILSLPKPDIVPTTIVEALYPSSDLLPENQLKLYVHFSAPMRMGDGLPFIKLLDASGEEVVDPFLPLGGEFQPGEAPGWACAGLHLLAVVSLGLKQRGPSSSSGLVF